MIGIDEVGRGCWAGPLLVVAARSNATLPSGLKDSKKLSKLQRQNLYQQIISSCDIGKGWVTTKEIDANGLAAAMRMGVARALSAVDAQASEPIIMDGIYNYCDEKFTNVKCQAKADDLYPVVSAASIYAKVTRDKYMANLGAEYHKYEFGRHVGYGTKLHQELI